MHLLVPVYNMSRFVYTWLALSISASTEPFHPHTHKFPEKKQ